MTEIVVAVFPTGQAAEAAMRDLEAAGIPGDTIRRHRDPNAIPAEHRSAYERALAAGGTVLTVPIEQTHAERVIGILDRHRPVEIEEHPAARRLELDETTGRVW